MYYNPHIKNLFKIVSLTMVLLAATLFLNRANADTLEDIQSKGAITVIAEGAYPPFDYREKGELVGYNIDLAKKVAEKNDWDINFVILPFDGIFPALLAKRGDLVVAALTVNKERLQRYAFTRPVGTGQHIVVAAGQNDDINNAEDLAGKRVGLQLGSSFEPEMEALNDQLKSDGLKPMNLKKYESFPQMFTELINKKIDAYGTDAPLQGSLEIKRPDIATKMVAPLNDISYISWAARKEDKNLSELIDNTIEELKSSGELAEIQKEWFGDTEILTPPADEVYPEVLAD